MFQAGCRWDGMAGFNVKRQTQSVSFAGDSRLLREAQATGFRTPWFVMRAHPPGATHRIGLRALLPHMFCQQRFRTFQDAFHPAPRTFSLQLLAADGRRKTDAGGDIRRFAGS